MDGLDNAFGLRGFLIDAPEFGTLRGSKRGGIIVEDGKIAAVGEYDDLRRSERAKGIRALALAAAAYFSRRTRVHRAQSEKRSASFFRRPGTSWNDHRHGLRRHFRRQLRHRL